MRLSAHSVSKNNLLSRFYKRIVTFHMICFQLAGTEYAKDLELLKLFAYGTLRDYKGTVTLNKGYYFLFIMYIVLFPVYFLLQFIRLH